jgi:hypothetical protein
VAKVDTAGQNAVASIGVAVSEVRSTVATFKETLFAVQATADEESLSASSLNALKTPKKKRPNNGSRRRQDPSAASGEYFGDTEDDVVQTSKVRGPKSPKVNRFHVRIVQFTL